MNFEQQLIPTQEKKGGNDQEKRIQITKDELEKYSKEALDSADLRNWMEEKGIEFNQGMIKVSIDGVNHLFSTDKNDFGTISYPDDKLGSEM